MVDFTPSATARQSDDARNNPYRHLLTDSLLQEREYYQFALAEIDAFPDEWDCRIESRDFILMQLNRIFAEVLRRKRLANSAHAPSWPKRDYASMRAELEEIRDRLDLVEYAEHYSGAHFTTKGKTFWSPCPLPGHDEQTASFHIDPIKQMFYCFGCHRGGDIFAFARHLYGIEEFPKVVDRLREHAGLKSRNSSSGLAIRGVDGSLIPLQRRTPETTTDPLRPSSYSL